MMETEDGKNKSDNINHNSDESSDKEDQDPKETATTYISFYGYLTGKCTTDFVKCNSKSCSKLKELVM
jgi:hypothetical protein